jgi:hypothetical protein
MSTARNQLAVARETTSPPRTAFLKSSGAFRFPTPLPAHGPRDGS